MTPDEECWLDCREPGCLGQGACRAGALDARGDCLGVHHDEGDPLPPSGRGSRERKAELVKATGLCPFCPYHGGENAGRRPAHGAQKPRSRRRR